MTNSLDKIEVGSLVDSYRVEEVISCGEMFAAYRAVDTRNQRQVALKVPTPLVVNDLVLFDRMRREAEIGHRLNHPSILKVEDAGSYFVVEWSHGVPLRDILAGGKLPPERAIRLEGEILEALEYVHLNGVFHRDLRPEHILVDSQDRIQLTDFGLAGSVAARRITYTSISPSLSAPYISPEQVKGKRGDARSDLYSAGVIFYEMLTGKLPFSADNPLVMMNERLLKPPIPPSVADPSVSPQLQEVLYRALESDPHQRYSSAHAFRHDLLHLDLVGVSERKEEKQWRDSNSPMARRFIYFFLLVLLPVIALSVMFFVLGPR